MSEDRIVKALAERFALQVRTMPISETVLILSPQDVRPAAQLLGERFGITHLSTITGQDVDDEIQLLYHFWGGRGLTLRTALSREEARIASLVDLIPGAAFYEREVGEMLHVTFVGHPDPRPLLLPDDWNGEAPLRREFDHDGDTL